MSTTETAEQTALLCPSCSGPLEAMQTICAACRSALEEQVLAVRAADYPALFHNVVRSSAEPPRGPIDPTSMDMLKVAENTSDDLDLVPLVPIDEPRKAQAVEPAAAASSPAPVSTASAVDLVVPLAVSPTSAAAPSPVARPSPTVYTPPSAPKLEPSSRWKHVAIAVVCLAAAAGLAALLWSVLVPGRAADASAQPPAVKPATK